MDYFYCRGRSIESGQFPPFQLVGHNVSVGNNGGDHGVVLVQHDRVIQVHIGGVVIDCVCIFDQLDQQLDLQDRRLGNVVLRRGMYFVVDVELDLDLILRGPSRVSYKPVH